MLLGRLFRKRSEPVATGEGASLVFLGGKGGVGKTTCASAYALARAREGEQVLVISTDPAHSLGDLWLVSLGDGPRPVARGVQALELDPAQALERYINQVRENLRDLASPEVREAAEHQASLAAGAPGAEEAALLDELVRVTLDNEHEYDRIVFDTAPTGHTLQLLQLPEVMRSWTDALLAKRREAVDTSSALQGEEGRPEDRAARILAARRDRYTAMRDRLRDPNRTRFIPVLNPDRLSREETRRMVATLGEVNVRVDTLILNRILPESADGDFARQRRASEAEHIAATRKAFPRLKMVQLPLATTDISRGQGLEELAEAL
ncbi:ArsA family ATPase [Halomonadaceae bacterium KBTZ08]